jgi:hypothetical protein
VGSLAASWRQQKLLGSSKLKLLLGGSKLLLGLWQQRAPSWPLAATLRGSTRVLLTMATVSNKHKPGSQTVPWSLLAHHVPSQSLPPQQNQADQFFSRQWLGMGCLATVFTQAFIDIPAIADS